MIYHSCEGLYINYISNSGDQWPVDFNGLLEIFDTWMVPNMKIKAKNNEVGSNYRDMV